MAVIKIKGGDTLSLVCTDSSGDLTGINIAASILVSPDVRRKLTVEETDMANGIYTIIASGTETASWPNGSLPCDIKYSAAGVISHSQNFEIYKSQEVTQ